MTEFRFPASFAQQRLWLIEQLQPGLPVYHLFYSVRVKEAIDPAVLHLAMDEVVRRHEALRTRFDGSGGVPVQVIDSERHIELPCDDLSGASEPEREAVDLARREAAEIFDLERGPLVRVRLVRMGNQDFLVFVTMHHIISDGWSMEVFFRELSALYEAFRSGEPSPLPELVIQYGDYSEWQRKWLQGEVFDAQLQYWKRQLKDAPAVLALPSDHPRPVTRSFSGGRLQLTLDSHLTAAVRELSRREGVTPFMTLLAAFQMLLWRYSGQDDIVVGSAVAGRRQPELEPLIGFFANTLPLRVQFSASLSFRDLLQQVKSTALEAYEYQDFPFEKVVEELNPERTLSHDPLVQVFFAYQNLPDSPNGLFDSTSSTGLELDRGISRSDLSVFLREYDEKISGIIEYSSDLFEAATIRRMAGHFERLLNAAVVNPGLKVSQLSLLSDEELRQILWEWNPPETKYPRDRCVHELFEIRAQESPSSVAVVYEDQRLSYAELNRRANQLAHYLRRLGVGPEERVALRVERSLDMVVGLLGILKAGGAYVPVDPAYPRERTEFILSDAGARILVTQQRLLESASEPGVTVVCLDRDWAEISKQATENPVSGATAKNLAYVIYTSGSTGKPKGVAVEHGSVTHLIAATQPIFKFSREDVWTVFHSYGFDFSVWEFFGALLNGARLVVVPQETTPSAELLHDLLIREAVTILNLTPSVAREVVRVCKTRRGTSTLRLRYMMVGGEALPGGLAAELDILNGELWNFYGPTESTVWAAIKRVEPEDCGREIVPIGRALPDIELYVLDNASQLLPAGIPGELCIAGAGLARGYFNRPELNAEKFTEVTLSPGRVERVYRTGDLARFRADGSLEFLGRTDHQIKLRGYRIELGEIESALSQHPRVAECIAIVSGNSEVDKRIVAYVVPQGQPPTSPELRQFLKNVLPEYMVPSLFLMLDSLPVSPHGKVDRRALPDPGEALRAVADALAFPRSPEEEMLCAIWSDLLHTDKVGIHDNFFEIGGHSLLATQLLSRMRATFGIALPLRQIFETPTVAELALVMGQQTKTGEEPEIVKVGRDRPLPLSFSQERLWFVDQLHPGNPFYNVPLALRFRGPLNTRASEQAINEIIRRHETLRTTFSLADGNPVQVIHAFSTLELRLRDVSDVPESLRLTEARLHAEEEVRLPFALDREPPVRAELIRVAADDHILVITFHHIATDAWSLAVFSGELSRLYTAFVRGEAPRLPELAIQFADYACWQRELLDGEHLRDELEYWKRTLAGAPDLVCFRNTLPRSGEPTFAGARHAVHLPEKLATALAALSRQQGVTLFMTFMAAFQILLRSYTDQQEMLIGTDLANRTRVELEPLIGFFVNLLPLRTNMDGNPTFLELLQRVRNTTMEAYAHQSLPFEKLVAEIKPGRSLNYNPLLQVLLVFTNVTAQQLHFADLEVKPFELEWNASRFDVALFLREIGSVVRAAWVYNADLFPEEMIREMAARFESLLTQIVERPNERLSHFDVQLRPADDGVSGESRQSAAVPVQKLKEVKRRTVDLDL